MGTPRTHRDVIAWRQAMVLVEAVYRDTARFPREEAFGLAAQIRHAALEVPARLAEGATRGSVSDLIRLLGASCGSLAALETQLEIAVRLGYLEPDARAVIGARRLGVLVFNLRQALSCEGPWSQMPR
jgi:four helix bundle protein